MAVLTEREQAEKIVCRLSDAAHDLKSFMEMEVATEADVPWVYTLTLMAPRVCEDVGAMLKTVSEYNADNS